MDRSERLELSLESGEPSLGGGRLLTAPSSKWFQNLYQKDESNDTERYLTFHEVIEAADKYNVPSVPIDNLGVQIDDSSSREIFALGSGSTSQVIQHVSGEDTKHIVPPNTTVAVKRFRAQNQDDNVPLDSEVRREVYKAILSEIQTVFHTSLRGHPNLAQPLFLGWLEGESFPIIAMQLGDHGSLDLIIRAANSRPSATEKRHITFDIALGLRAIHRAGIVHCDLKPDNILVMTHNDPSRQLIAKLTDFGGSFRPTQQEASRPVHVTPLWCAPEVLNHDPDIDWQKADVYSFGLVIGSLWASDYGKLKERLGRRSSCFLSRPNKGDDEEDWLWTVKVSPDGCAQVLKQVLEQPLLGEFLPEKADNAELLEILTPTLHRYFWRRPNSGDLLQSLRYFEGETGRNILEEDEVAANGNLTGQDVAANAKSEYTWADNPKFKGIHFEQCSFAAGDFKGLVDFWETKQDADIPPQVISHDGFFDNLHHSMTRLIPSEFYKSPACLARPGAQARLARLSWELAMCHYFGRGTSKNLETSFKWMRISALCGLRKAMHMASLMATKTTTESWFPIRLCFSLLALSGSDLALERLSIHWPDLFKITREIIQERYLAYQAVRKQQGETLYLHTLEPYHNLRYHVGPLETIRQAVEVGAIDEIEQVLNGGLKVEDLERMLPDLLHWLVHLTDDEASTLAEPAFKRGAKLDALRKYKSPLLGVKSVIDTVYSPISSAIVHGKPRLTLTIFCLHIESDTPIVDFPTALFLSFRYLQPEVSGLLLGLLRENPSMCRNDTMPWIFNEAHIHSLPGLAISLIQKEAPLNELLSYTIYHDDPTELERRSINDSDIDNRYEECLKILLESGADPTEGISVVNPLYNALIHDDLKLGSENVEHSALLWCIAFDSIRCFEFLIRHFPALMFDDQGDTPLLYACSRPQSASFVNLLLENGADTMAVDLFLGDTSPLFAALIHGSLRAADLIAERCSARDLDRWLSRNDEGISVFLYVVLLSRNAKLTSSVEWLIGRGGAHFYGPDSRPIWYILFMEPRPTRRSDRIHTALLSILLNLDMFSAKLNTERLEGLTLLHLLVFNGYVEAVKLLLKHKADINVDAIFESSSQRFTALDFAYHRLRGEDYPLSIMTGGRFEMERWVEDIHSIIRLLRSAGGKSLIADPQTWLSETVNPKTPTRELNIHNLMLTKHRQYRGDWPRPLPSEESSNPIEKLIEANLAQASIAREDFDRFVDYSEPDLEEAKNFASKKRSDPEPDGPESTRDATGIAQILRKTWRLPPGWGHVTAMGLVDMTFFINLETGDVSDEKPGLYCGEHDEINSYDRKGKAKATATTNDRDGPPRMLIIALPPESPLIPILDDLSVWNESVPTRAGNQLPTDRQVTDGGHRAFGFCDSAETVKDFGRTLNGTTLVRLAIRKIVNRASIEGDIIPGAEHFIGMTRDIIRKNWDGVPPRPETLIEGMLQDMFEGRQSIDKIKDFVKTTGMVDEEHCLGSTPYPLVNLLRPLHDAIMRDDMKAFVESIEKCEIEIENWEGHTPLELAIFLDRVDMASILLAHEAKIPDKAILKTGLPALHYSVIRGNIEMTKLLLGSGIDPNRYSPEGVLPLQFCYGFNPEMAMLLMQNGADFDLGHRAYLMQEMTTLQES
ncbi:ankyrin [Jackrogersella minutella]|nr:ankyrin [Jackrogersella minutella]